MSSNKQKHNIRTNWILVFHHIVSHNLYTDKPQYYFLNDYDRYAPADIINSIII